VVVIPLEVLAGLAGAPPAELSDRDLRFLSLTVEQEVAGMAVDITDGQGRFGLELPAGEYGLCLAYGEGDGGSVTSELRPPFSIRGCGRLLLEAGQVQRVTVSSGFGEILVEPEGGL
jgi:hypothetical protein